MKKLGILCLVLVLGLALLGLGYARWAETLYIRGTVNTGSLDAKMIAGKSWDSEPEGKNYSSISCTVTAADPKTLVVTLTNAYPSIDYCQEFEIENCGTIPLHIDKVTINRGNLPTGASVHITGIKPSTQVHPDEKATGRLHVHLYNDAAMDTTYTFSVCIDVGQWNIPPYPAPPAP